jgi:signal transduction histidine kinase
LVCLTFAAVLVLFSFLEPELIGLVQLAPGPARAGILLLTAGLIALVWEQDRHLRRLEEQIQEERLGRATQVAKDREALDYLRASHVVRSRFLSTVSHELRTPLTSIIGFSDTLTRHWDRLTDEHKRTSIEAVSSQSWRLWRLIERVLQAAQVELEGVSIEPKHHDVRLSVAAGLDRFSQAARDRIEIEVPPEELHAEIDPFVLKEVVTNLVDNALRYAQGAVRLQLSGLHDSVKVSVRDHGPGMSEAELSGILQPGYRVEENIQSGTGLGLDLVQTLVADHGGRFSISSGAGGTKVTVTLPRSTAKPLPLRRRRGPSTGIQWSEETPSDRSTIIIDR